MATRSTAPKVCRPKHSNGPRKAGTCPTNKREQHACSKSLNFWNTIAPPKKFAQLSKRRILWRKELRGFRKHSHPRIRGIYGPKINLGAPKLPFSVRVPPQRPRPSTWCPKPVGNDSEGIVGRAAREHHLTSENLAARPTAPSHTGL